MKGGLAAEECGSVVAHDVVPWCAPFLQEYNKSQVVSLISLVATVNNWKRKVKVDLLERIETGDYFS